MKVINRDKGPVYQGDLAIIPVDEIPSDVVEAKSEGENHIVAHSETGHHHVVPTRMAKLYVVSAMMSYLRVVAEQANLQHLRPYDTHETVALPKGDYQLLRQREGAPEGWRQVAD
jgi:hypothetical protein